MSDVQHDFPYQMMFLLSFNSSTTGVTNVLGVPEFIPRILV